MRAPTRLMILAFPFLLLGCNRPPENRPDFSVPADSSLPADASPPVDNSVPGDATLPTDSSAPVDLAAPRDASAAPDLAVPRDASAAPDLAAPPDASAAPDLATPPDATPAGDSATAPTLDTPIEPGDPGSSDIRFTVRTDGARPSISPLIYGTNGPVSVTAIRPGLLRAGGNRWTAYNWENNASNAGSDYLYQNDEYLVLGLPQNNRSQPGEAVRFSVESAQTIGAATLLTVPIVDYVAADKNGGGDIRNSPNYQTTRLRQNRAQKGSAFSLTPDPNDAFVYQDEFVAWTRNRFPSAQILYSLDNEPDLWAYTHPEVHSAAVGYDELCQRNTAFARAIKAVSPTAAITGFVSYGYAGYLTLQDAPDRSGKGEFLDYYLTCLRNADLAFGQRLIEYLDLHWYPEARGGGQRIIDTGTGAAEVEARVQAPRSLWDPTYVEDSWIARDVVGGPVRLLPWLNDKIQRLHPGTRLAFTEWNYGGGDHISGALATADVLGIFGRDGVALASLWELNADESFTYAGFLAYRNFDGSGGRFGDTSLSATTSDAAAASVYASLDAGDIDRVVLVLINKRTTALRAGLTVAHPRRFSQAAVYTVTATAAGPRAAGTIPAVATNAFNYTMPAQSISVLVLTP